MHACAHACACRVCACTHAHARAVFLRVGREGKRQIMRKLDCTLWGGGGGGRREKEREKK